MVTKSVKLPKPDQIIKCKFTNDEDQEWRKLNAVSRIRKATGKNKYLINVAMEGGDPFWLDFEHGILEWETSIETDQTSTDEAQNPTNEASVLVTTSSNENLDQARNGEIKSWIEHQVYTQVRVQGQPKICMRWVYTNKGSNGK